MQYIEKSFIKLNLNLRIFTKLPNGYHHLHTCFWRRPSPEYLVIETQAEGVDTLTVHGTNIQGENLVSKVLKEVRKTSEAEVPLLRIKLIKALPSGSGIGAGSGNAACLLRWLSRNGVCLSGERIAALGADIAFLAKGDALAMAEGVGDVLLPLTEELDLPTLLVFPKWRVATSKAYAMLDASRAQVTTEFQIDEARTQSRQIVNRLIRRESVGLLPNDFLDLMYPKYFGYSLFFQLSEKHNGLAWGMSGSGSSMFCVLKDKDGLSRLSRDLGALPWVSKVLTLE